MPSVNDGLDCFGVAATGRVVNILTARGEIDLEKLKFAVYDFTSMYTKFTHKMIMTQMTKLLTYVYRRQAAVLRHVPIVERLVEGGCAPKHTFHTRHFGHVPIV